MSGRGCTPPGTAVRFVRKGRAMTAPTLAPPPQADGHHHGRHICVLPSSPAAAREARRWAAGLVAGELPATVADDVGLVVSELVTNAVVHGTCEVVMCRLVVRADRVRIEVGERGNSQAPSRGSITQSEKDPAEHGRGLLIVASLSASWGLVPPVVGSGDGSVAWAEIEAAPQGNAT